jgi:hypothetical protein
VRCRHNGGAGRDRELASGQRVAIETIEGIE